jgi:hypothetical protein
MSTKVIPTKEIEKVYGSLTFGKVLKAHREAACFGHGMK